MADDYFEVLKETEKAKKRRLELREKFRKVFCSSPVGQEVLSHILIEFCHFGCYLKPEMIGAANVGVSILSQCGIFNKGKSDNVVRALCGVASTFNE